MENGDGFNRHLKFTMTCLSFNVIRFHSSLFVIRFRVFPSSQFEFLIPFNKMMAYLCLWIECERELCAPFIHQILLFHFTKICSWCLYGSSSFYSPFVVDNTKKKKKPTAKFNCARFIRFIVNTMHTIYNLQCTRVHTHRHRHTHAQSQTIWDVNHSLLSITERQSITKQYKFINY